ncbi:hypothetical protein KC330_g107 [Hortaea werneckii]|nr:hypothetical protein KC330_g107 [Hortaea werneckii]
MSIYLSSSQARQANGPHQARPASGSSRLRCLDSLCCAYRKVQEGEQRDLASTSSLRRVGTSQVVVWAELDQIAQVVGPCCFSDGV